MRARLALPAILAAALAAHADPYVGYIYPAGIQAGTTNCFVVGGQNLMPVQGFHFAKGGLKVLKIERVPLSPPPPWMQRKHLVNWLDGIAAGNREEPPLPNDPHINEWRSNSWWRALGSLDAQQISIVEYDLFVPKNPLQMSPSLRQMLLVTVAADADATPGWRSFVGWAWNGLSAPRQFEVTTTPRTAEPLYVAPHRPQPEPPLVDVRKGRAVLDGQILPGSTDAFRLHLAGKRRYSFKVTARELQPYIGDAVPGFFNAVITLKDSRGNTVAVADDEARFRPDPVLIFSPPADGIYSLEIHDVLYRGRADFVYTIDVDTARPDTRPRADGVVQRNGKVSSKTFRIDSPGPRVLEVMARRRGSPLDPVLTLRRKAGGPVLAQWDDVTNTVFTGTVPQSECDPIGTYDFKEAGEYVAEITDRTGHGGDNYLWWLDVRRPTPDFEVYSTRSTLPLKGGQTLRVGFRVLRKDGFSGEVRLDFPPDIRAYYNVVTAGTDSVTAALTPAEPRRLEIHPVRIEASAVIDGKTVRHPVVPCDEYEQAFAWKHLVPADDFLLDMLPGQKRKAAVKGKKRDGAKKKP